MARPLYIHDVDITGLGRKSLVIVATAANIIYALIQTIRASLFRGPSAEVRW